MNRPRTWRGVPRGGRVRLGRGRLPGGRRHLCLQQRRYGGTLRPAGAARIRLHANLQP